jgi:ribosomal protein S18 acetylase RimI-like enzyme
MITVRQAKTSDAAAIRKIQMTTWLDTYSNREHGITRRDILAKDFESAENVEKTENTIRQKGEWRLFVAERDGVVVGWNASCKGKKEYVMGGTYVLPEFQNQGTGKLLVERAFKYLGRAKKITCEVVAFNTQGIRFWEKRGFKIVGRCEYRFPTGKKMPLLKMEL